MFQSHTVGIQLDAKFSYAGSLNFDTKTKYDHYRLGSDVQVLKIEKPLILEYITLK